MHRRSFLAGSAAVLAACRDAQADTVKVRIGVGGKPLLYYLPLTVAERKGYFAEEGVEAEISDFGGGARSLQALVGGSVDVVTGAYEHTIRMKAKGQDVRAVCELGRLPAIVIAVRKDLAGTVKSVADFKGRKVGVTAPGSSTALAVQFAMIKAGLKATDAPLIGIGGGAGAVAAIKRGEIDAIAHLDPVIAKLEADGDIQILVDTRTEAGTRALFGGPNPAAVVYTKQDWIEHHPAAMQRVVNAFAKALKWLATASPEAIADLVPATYQFGDRALYVQAVGKSLESYSRTGIPTQEGMTSVLDLVRTLDAEMQSAQIDLATTFDDRFIKRAMG